MNKVKWLTHKIVLIGLSVYISADLLIIPFPKKSLFVITFYVSRVTSVHICEPILPPTIKPDQFRSSAPRIHPHDPVLPLFSLATSLREDFSDGQSVPGNSPRKTSNKPPRPCEFSIVCPRTLK